MIVTYKPENGEQASWDFNPNRIRANQQIIVEKQFRGTWDEFLAALRTGSVRARQVLLWHLRRQTHPAFRFEEVPDFYSDELKVEFSLSELLELKEAVEKSNHPSKDLALDKINLDIEERKTRDEQEDPKAPQKI